MNKNFKIFQIHGLSGLLMLCFIASCLFFGFVLFPIWAIMTGWNEIIAVIFQGPVINYLQASLLWTMVIILLYLTFRNSISIKICTSEDEINNAEIKDIICEAEEVPSSEEKL